jgi:hypothetical protein
MDSNYKLLNISKYSLKIMKFQGIFFHRGISGKVSNNSILMDSNNENCIQNKSLAFGTELEKYFKKHDILQKTSLNKLHFVYCIIFCLFKIIGFPILSLVQLYLNQLYFNQENITKTNITSSYLYSNSAYVESLVYLAVSIVYIHFLIIPIYFLAISGAKNGFHRSILSFEYLENEIKTRFDDYNKTISSQSNINLLIHSNQNFRCSFLNIIYVVFSIAVPISTSAFYIYSTLTSPLINDYLVTQIVHFIMYIVTFPLLFADYATGLHFIITQIIHIKSQIESFHKYLDALIQNEIDIDIESIRDFYNKLHQHVKVADKWICCFYGIIYITIIPVLCIFLYALVLGQLKTFLFQSLLQFLVVIIFEIVSLTVVAVMMNTKVYIIL